MFPYKKNVSADVLVRCQQENDLTVIINTNKEEHSALICDDELLSLIDALTELANAKGLSPVTETPAPAREFEPEHPFYPLPEGANVAAIIYDAFVTSDGVERHAVAYVNDDGILILEAIGNERNSIEYAQFGTDDLRAMLALKENAR